jgi:3,4-dihydroxy-2-butanone 4-phosphate synthase
MPRNSSFPSSTIPAKKPQVCDPVEVIIADIRAGKVVIVTGDEDRENEGDLIYASEKITLAMVSFIVREGSGMLCLPVSLQIAQHLENKGSKQRKYHKGSVPNGTGLRPVFVENG